MEQNEQTFTRLILENKSTIYTVCFMFSKDREEVEHPKQKSCGSLSATFSIFCGKVSAILLQ